MEVLQTLQNNPQTLVLLTGAQLREFALAIIEETTQAIEQARTGDNDLMTSADVRDQLKISVSTLWRYTRAGLLRPIKTGGRNLFRRSDVQKLIETEQ